MADEATRRKLRAALEESVRRTPYLEGFPCKIEDIDEGRSELRFFVDEQFCNRRSIAHGGVLAAFCDTLMGMATRSLGYQVATLEINMNYIRPVAVNHYVHGVGQVVHKGKRTVVVECECRDDDGCVVVKGRSSFYILGDMKI